MRAAITIILLGLFSITQAQKGTITGKVINASTGDVLVGATLNLTPTNRKAATDQNGQFTFRELADGTYLINVSFTGYSGKEVSEIIVKNGTITDVNISLALKVNELDNVIIRSPSARENQGALLISQKNSPVVSDGISAELIRKTPDRNSGDVLKRISGVSIQDNKFAVVRGLNDRYNAAYLNGAPLPSSENDRKAFAFDIFPANILENLVISKTASPDLPGEFAGGIINISTTAIPVKNFTSISVGTGYNTITTFKEGLNYKGGKSDWIGLDDGTRAIPNGLPQTVDFPAGSSDRAKLAKLYTTNNWGVNSRHILPNSSFQISQGLNIKRRGTDFFGLLVSATYNKTFSYSAGELNSYEYNRDNPSDPPIPRAKYATVNTHSEATLAGLVANFSLKLNSNNKISFKNILSVNADDRVIMLDGQPDASADPEFRTNASGLWYTSNVIATSQLYGDHNLSKSKIKFNWLVSYGQVDRKIPDLRQLNYAYSEGQDNYSAGIVTSTISSDNSGSRFYSNTNEKIYSSKFDLSRNFDGKKNFQTIIKAGAYYQYRNRSFDARLLGFGIYRPSDGFNNNLLSLSQDKIFDTANLGLTANGKGGFLLLDGTNPTFAYDASSTLVASYLMFDNRIGKKIRAVYGLRMESFEQKLNSFLDFTTPLVLNTQKTDLLPSVNLVYSVNAKQNIRVSYSKTVNRPEFRELAPFAFFDFSNRIVVGGNPNLVRASINNFDLRYEVYPGKGQLLSVSGFYKHFTNPIELTSDPNNFNSTAYQNALEGKNYGVELEFRTQLSSLLGTNDGTLLSHFIASANASFIFSNVKEAPFAGVVKGVENRSLQGQSPYLFNAGLSYNQPGYGWSASVSANRVGQRIYIVGSLNEPDTWEQGRTIVDFQVAKSLLNNKLEIKLNCRDLLRQKQIFFLDLDESKSYHKNKDLIFNARSYGSVISVTATYKF
ncbi:MAG: TonB-dependent receptor [Bacteroidota bacterium]